MQQKKKAVLDMYNTCNNNSGNIWYGTYYNEETGSCSDDPEAGVLVTIDRTVREQLEADGVDILGIQLDCVMTQDQFKVGKKKGKYYYRIVEATPLKSVELSMPKLNATMETNIELVAITTVRIGRAVIQRTIKSNTDIENLCQELEIEAIRHANAEQLINSIDVLGNRLDKYYVNAHVESKPDRRGTTKVSNRRSQS